MAAIGRKPGERASITDPRNKSAMKVHSSAVLRSFRPHNGCIHRDDVLRWQLIVESELDRLAPLRNNDSTEMSLALPSSAEGNRWIETPECSWTKRRMYLIGELTDVDGVVSHTG